MTSSCRRQRLSTFFQSPPGLLNSRHFRNESLSCVRTARSVMKCFLILALSPTLALGASPSPFGQGEAVPTNASEMVAKARTYATEYIDRLPNFLCLQTTTHSTAGKKGEHWHRKDIQTAQLVFAGGKEKRTLQAVNGKPVSNGNGRGSRNQLTTEGEFGILLANILGPDSAADITWQGFENLRDHQVAVVKYAVDQPHSTLRLSRDYLTSAFVAYDGRVFFDPKTGAVLRITKELSDIPPNSKPRTPRP